MIRTYLQWLGLGLTLVLAVFASASARADYTVQELEATALDVPDNATTVSWRGGSRWGAGLGDDSWAQAPIGFDFTFGSTNYNSLIILTNGILHFSTPSQYSDASSPSGRAADDFNYVYNNGSLPVNNYSNFVAPYWDDLVDDNQAQVSYGTIGTAPDRRFVVTWSNVRAYDNNRRYDFQVVLYENGDIRYRYNNNTANGESATIGLEVNNSDFLQYSFNEVSVETSFDLLFRNRDLMLPDPVAAWHLDEAEYTGSNGEVVDFSGGGNDGRSSGTATTDDSSPVYPGVIGTCGYANFNGVLDYLEVADAAELDLPQAVSVGTWIRPTAYPTVGDLGTILSKDTNYEFHLTRDGNLFLWWEWDGSSSGPNSITSAAQVPLNQWMHVAVVIAQNRQRIYLNGIEAASSSGSGNLRTNNLPLQIGSDQNTFSRYFTGDIDEVQIFDVGLSQAQVRELMEQTHPCESANLCVGSFPDGLASHSAGDIEFGFASRLFFSPTDSLYASSVQSNGGNRSCVTVDCRANGQAAPITDQPAFKNASSGNNQTVGFQQTATLGPATTRYNRVQLDNESTLNVSSGADEYRIRRLELGYRSTLNLAPGDYWIDRLEFTGNEVTINVTGSGSARLYVRRATNISYRSQVNPSTSGSAEGDVSRLYIYAYDSVTFANEVSYSGLIYAEGDVSLGFQSAVYGAVTANDITLANEVEVYYYPDAIARTNFGDLCSGLSCNLGGFTITQPAYSLACPFTRAGIGIQVLCDDGTTIKDDYTGTFDLTSSENANSLFYDAASGGSQISSVTMSEADAGETTVYLFHQNENPDLQVTATDRDSGIGSTAAAGTDVRTEGFALLTAPTDFVCGATTNMQLVAIGDDESGAACQQLTGFSGSKGMKAWFNANLNQPPAAASTTTVSTPLVLNGTAIIDQSRPADNNFNLTFTDGVADINVAYANAAELQAINLVHDDAPYSGTPDAGAVGIDELTLATSSIVARPEQIVLSVASAAASCSSADASCSPFVSAGSGFDMTAQAQCTGGGIASDFIGTISLDSLLVAPADGDNAIVGTSSVAISSNGSVDFQQSVDNIGVYSLTADANYFGTALSTNTLANIGRFYPDYFDMPVSTLTQSCSGGFTYMDQYGIDVSYRLVARNSDGYIVTNYEGAFASATRYWEAEDSDDGIDRSSRIASDSSDAGVWSGGVQNRAESLTFSRASSPDGPYNNLSIALGINDNDGGLSILDGMDINPATTGDCIASGACTSQQLGEVDVRYGVMRLESAFGPETETLQQQVNMVYWDSDGNLWRVNTDDSCTVLAADSATLIASNWSGNLSSGDITASVAQQTTNGTGILQYSAPGVGNDGSVEFTYNVPDWLRGEWDDDGDYADTPTSLIQFGQYRGHDRIIYWRDPVR